MWDHFGLDYSHHYLCVCVIMHYMIVSCRNLIVKLCFSIFASLHLCLCICVFVFVLQHICFSCICVYCNSKTVVCGAVAHFRKQPICSSKSKQNNCTQNCPQDYQYYFQQNSFALAGIVASTKLQLIFFPNETGFSFSSEP